MKGWRECTVCAGSGVIRDEEQGFARGTCNLSPPAQQPELKVVPRWPDLLCDCHGVEKQKCPKKYVPNPDGMDNPNGL